MLLGLVGALKTLSEIYVDTRPRVVLSNSKTQNALSFLVKDILSE